MIYVHSLQNRLSQHYLKQISNLENYLSSMRLRFMRSFYFFKTGALDSMLLEEGIIRMSLSCILILCLESYVEICIFLPQNK